MAQDQRPSLRLVGLNGNVFNVIGHARKAAREAGWTQEEIKHLEDKLTGKLDPPGQWSYDHVIAYVMDHFDVY